MPLIKMSSAAWGWKGCVLLIASAGAIGGLINAYFTDHGLKHPSTLNGIWCPGAIGNVIVGSVSAIISWTLYGSGAAVDITNPSPRELVSLRLSALAGAALVGMAGARWLSSEVDKQLSNQNVQKLAERHVSQELTQELQRCDTQRKVAEVIAGA